MYRKRKVFTFTFKYDKNKSVKISAPTEEQAKQALCDAWVDGNKIVTGELTLVHKEETWGTR